MDEFEWEVEAAGADEFEQGLEAWGDGPLLPSGYDRSVTPGSLSELCLGEAGPQAGFSDECCASHVRSIRLRYATCNGSGMHICYASAK